MCGKEIRRENKHHGQNTDLCVFACDFLVDDVKELKSDSGSEQHNNMSVDNWNKVAEEESSLASIKCNVFLNDANIDEHNGHTIVHPVGNEGIKILESTKQYARKRKLSRNREDPIYIHDKDNYIEENEFLDWSFEEKESFRAYNIEQPENSFEEKPEDTTTSYFYFCLDCEERSSGKSECVRQNRFL